MVQNQHEHHVQTALAKKGQAKRLHLLSNRLKEGDDHDARASELIPADAQGLFVCNDPDKTVFRAYYLDNKQLR